jgi:hypothetical protein
MCDSTLVILQKKKEKTDSVKLAKTILQQLDISFFALSLFSLMGYMAG